mgnify:CR=1 FL=1
MIPYKLPEEKETLTHYANLLKNRTALKVVSNDKISSKEEALEFANFFWEMVAKSNEVDKSSSTNSEYILEKIIITLMAYYRSSGYEEEWEVVADQN